MSTREDREAAMIAYNGPDSVNRPRHREWIERGGDDCGATVYGVAQAIANARAEGYARGQRALASHAAAAVERERERCAAYCEKRATNEKRDALACAEVSLSGCHDAGAYDRGRIEALRDAASALRSRPPRAGAETTCQKCKRRVATAEERAHRGDCDCAGCDGEACFGTNTAGCHCARAALRATPPRAGEGG